MPVGVLASAEAIKKLLGFARAVGLTTFNPETVTPAVLKAKFERVARRVVTRLEKDGHTPAKLGDTDEHRRALIRSAEFVLWKEAVRSLTGRAELTGEIADYVRDRHDDVVVPAVSGQVTPSMTTAALVAAVAAAELDVTF